MNPIRQSGFLFTNFKSKTQTPFEKLFEIFKELITYTSGDFDEAINWLRELDKEYVLTTDDYTMDDFIEDLFNKGYIKKEFINDKNGEGVSLTAKTEMLLRQHALKQIFGKMKRAGNGNHNTKYTGLGESDSGDLKKYEFGDSIEKIAITESIKNAHIKGGLDDFKLSKKYYKNIRAFIYGKHKGFFVKKLRGKIVYKNFKNLKDALKQILLIIKKEKFIFKTILFSPCAASFDEFKNFEDRGLYFNKLVKQYKNEIH